MTNDPENNKNLQDALKAYGLKQDIRRIHNEMMQVLMKKAPVRSLFSYANRIAAAVLIFIVAAAIVVYFTATPSNLFNGKYEPYEQSAQRGDTASATEITRLFLEGQRNLRQGNAVKAANIFSDIIRTNAQSDKKILNDDAEYYLGLAYLKVQDARDALRIFQHIHNDRNHLYNDKVTTWFLLRVKIAAWKQK